MTKRTFRPSKKYRNKVNGFRKRLSTRHGKNVIKRRKIKGRRRL